MNDNHNIEKFFRDKFNQLIRPEYWNTPDDSIWENISSELEKKGKVKKLFHWMPFILGACIFLSGCLGYLFFKQKQEISNLETALFACKENQESQKFTSIDNQKEIKKVPLVQNIRQISKENTASDFHKKYSGTKKTVSGSVESKNSKELVVILQKKDEIPSQNVELSFDAEKTTIQPVFPPQTLNYLPFVQLPEQFIKRPLIVFTENPKTTPESVGQNILLGTSIGMLFWIDHKKGKFSNPLSELLKAEKTEISPLFGIKTNIRLSDKWSFSGGIEYYKRNQRSEYQVNLPYSTLTEINTGADYENRFTHSLPTGLGNVNTNLTLSRTSGSQILEDENVLLDFGMSNESDILSVPLSVNYYPLESGKGIYLTGGIRTEIVLRNQISEVAILSHHDIIKNKHFSVEYDALQINKLNLSAIVGIGYKKSLGKNYFLTMEVLYGNALNPVYRTENYRHDINFAGSQLSILKRL